MHPLEHLDFSTTVAKRAQYEALALSIFGTDILVRNESHETPSDHEYLVTVEDGLPVSCTCPADARFDGACKHRVAVAIQRPLLDVLRCQQAGEPPHADRSRSRTEFLESTTENGLSNGCSKTPFDAGTATR
ncbi:SWIM zinc finger family protein [Haloarcula sp. GH36]|uniref:SWIM zinc finger family protein n=1 Tax=Haloarcula montana TaxID=3111776 RepID=UPI002D78C36C|nr:SWIM zinc finger family protein [Haloarcula sp. GH36]